MVKIKTWLGDLQVESVYHNSTGFWATTGKGLNQRSWMLTKTIFNELREKFHTNEVVNK